MYCEYFQGFFFFFCQPEAMQASTMHMFFFLSAVSPVGLSGPLASQSSGQLLYKEESDPLGQPALHPHSEAQGSGFLRRKHRLFVSRV